MLGRKRGGCGANFESAPVQSFPLKQLWLGISALAVDFPDCGGDHLANADFARSFSSRLQDGQEDVPADRFLFCRPLRFAWIGGRGGAGLFLATWWIACRSSGFLGQRFQLRRATCLSGSVAAGRIYR